MNKQIHNHEKVHYSKRSRKKFKWFVIMVWMMLFALLAATAVMFYFGGLHWDTVDPEPTPVIGTHPTAGEIVLIVLGIVLFLIICCIAVLVNYQLTIWFNKSKENYQASELFQQKKSEALKVDLKSLSKSNLKWYKKLNFISKETYSDTKELKKREKKES